MATVIIPDRERRHLLQFHFWPSLTYGPRLALSAVLVLGGIAWQLLAPRGGYGIDIAHFWSVLPILIGNCLLLIKGYDLTPKDSKSEGAWERTTLEQFNMVAKHERSVRVWDETFADITCVSGILSLVGLGIATVFITAMLASNRATAHWAPFFVADAAVLIFPHWITGLRLGWRPVALTQQIRALKTAITTIQDQRVPKSEIQPMFQLAGLGEKRVPMGARVFVRFPDAPPDFIGLQFQVALNNVQGTQYPYLYAVVIAKPEFGLEGRYAAESVGTKPPRGICIEQKSQGDVDVIVIRQTTTRNSGYHTKDAAIREIVSHAWKVASEIAR